MNPSDQAPQSINWRGRAATRLSNGLIELTVLTGGGHLAALRLLTPGDLSTNVLWEAPWLTADPTAESFQALAESYGPVATGRFLAAYTGHALCLDYFGAPSTRQAAAGLGIHGEAACRCWNVSQTEGGAGAACRWSAQLPLARLNFEREIRLGDGERVIFVEETVTNECSIDRSFHWVQHVAFGPPFLNSAECTLAASGNRGMTSPSDYEGCSLLATHREFLWPHAPRDGSESRFVDLRRAFSTKGSGFLACVQMDTKRRVQYMLAVNWKQRLVVGYCFRTDDFPWMAIWEENCARQSIPWNGRTRARGMEFGTTPMPLTPDEPFPGGTLFNTRGWCISPANGVKTARYILFLAAIPAGLNSIESAEVEGDIIQLYNDQRNSSVSISAQGCEKFLSA